MSSGEHFADELKHAFRGVNDAGEGLRNNINSFADGLFGGNKAHSSTDIHPDAKRTGNEMEKSVESAGKKLDEMMHHRKK